VKALYSSEINWLFGTQLFGVKLGLENVRHLLAALGNPQNETRFIHVAGTNGKGSVSAMIDSMARAAGIKSGLFTSPHLIRFNGRIQVNGLPISDDEVVGGIQRIRAVIDQDRHPTFFEITTALALDYFRKQSVELAVLETGLGGRLDATNVVTPLVSVLTSIDLDHQKWLGDSLAQIASEKAGIIKPGIPVVSGPQSAEVRLVLERTALERAAPISFSEIPVEGLSIGLAGSHQRLNAALAVDAVRNAGLGVNAEALKDGLANVQWPGRFQRFSQRIVLDGGHNPAAAKRLVETWRECFGAEKATIIFGGLGDKDLQNMVSTLSAVAARFLLVPVRSPRAASTADLELLVSNQLSVAQCPSIKYALDAAHRFDEKILVTGSLFLVGETLAILQSVPDTFQISNQ
jgi:dihydrofolate synthase / folylpolyglutamate synthase